MDMAKTKTKMNGTASASKKQTGSDKGAAAAAPLTRADAVLVALTSKWDTLTNEDRAVLAAKYSDKQCEAKGAETKSEGVLSDALGTLGQAARPVAGLGKKGGAHRDRQDLTDLHTVPGSFQP